MNTTLPPPPTAYTLGSNIPSNGGASRGPSTKYVPSHVVETNVLATEEAPCTSWESLFKCPLTLFTILAVIGFIFNAASIWSQSQAAALTTSGIVLTVIALLIYVIVVVAFGYWMKKQCESCHYGTSWLIFFFALFFPIIAAFVIRLLIALFDGTLAVWSGSLNKTGKGPRPPTVPPQPPQVPLPPGAQLPPSLPPQAGAPNAVQAIQQEFNQAIQDQAQALEQLQTLKNQVNAFPGANYAL